ncbi:MAG: radical SAM protein [Planctomycetota bacterium]|jgi:MoaA/NifB/PqqE/SkfB family radical SAM enzyme|nr:radical SAM protein [Planctomycetota bacterium]
MAELRLDGHKLQYHPDRVADFLAGRPVWPINAEISPTSSCNHRCRFCNFNCLGHAARSLPAGKMPALMDELKRAEVKAVVFAGAGEPSLHPDTFPALRRARELGLDAALSTNGAPLGDRQLREMAELLTWSRFSINGGSPKAYAASQGADPADFARVLANLERLAAHKARSGSALTIGTQCVLISENMATVAELARRVKAAGADYFSVKHFYPHADNPYQPDPAGLAPGFLSELERRAGELSDTGFQWIVRGEEKLERVRPYRECLGLPFFVYLREDGGLYTCFSHQDDPQTAIGNLLELDFATLWQSAGKEAAIRRLNRHYDKNRCQANCRHHQINLWLDELRRPPPHVNFI